MATIVLCAHPGGCRTRATHKGLCKKHYDQLRVFPPSEEKTIYRRARQRASEQLIQAHPSEFAALMATALNVARAEALELRRHVDTQPVPAPAKTSAPRPAPHPVTVEHPAPPTPTVVPPVVKLRSGPRAGQDAVTRIDVGTCPACARHHDGQHQCPACHTDLTAWTDAPDDQARLAVLQRMICDHCGNNALLRDQPCTPTLGPRRAQHDFTLTRTPAPTSPIP